VFRALELSDHDGRWWLILTPTDKVPKSERGERIASAVRARAARDRADYKASPQQIDAFSKLGPDSLRMTSTARDI